MSYLQTETQNVLTQFSYKQVTGATTTVIKADRGVLHTVNVEIPGTSISVWDGPAATGTKIIEITTAGLKVLDVNFATNLTIVSVGSTCEFTVSYC